MSDNQSTLFAGIVADDVTGADASGALLAELGLRTFTAVDAEAGRTLLAYGDADVLSIPTASRNLSATLAARRVREATAVLLDARPLLLNKRIDSTLRGNVGAEIDAMLDVVQERVDERTRCVVVPAYPRIGRIACGGYLLIDGQPLSETEAANDPHFPMRRSDVVGLIADQSRRHVAFLALERLLAGRASLAASLTEAAADAEIIVLDATTQGHLDLIALALEDCSFPSIVADPGPAFAACAARRIARRTGSRPRVLDPGMHLARPPLLVVGSASLRTIDQLQSLIAARRVAVASVDADALARAGNARELARITDETRTRVRAALRDGAEAVAITTATHAADRRELTSEQGLAATRGLGEIVRALLDDAGQSPPPLVITGGDVTVAVCGALGALGIEISHEIQPLIVGGRISGGPFAGLPICTKGGLVGDRNALQDCVAWLERTDAPIEEIPR